MAKTCDHFIFRKEWYDLMNCAFDNNKDKLDFLMYIIEEGCCIDVKRRKSNPSDFVKGVAFSIIQKINQDRVTLQYLGNNVAEMDADYAYSNFLQLFNFL